MTATSPPPGLAALAQRLGISTDGWSAHERFDVRIDSRSRVRIRRGRRVDEMVLETRLASLPSSSRDCEDLLARVLLRVTAAAGRQVGVVTLSPDGRQLLLQAEIQGGDAGQFDTAFEAFLNETDYWNHIVRMNQP